MAWANAPIRIAEFAAHLITLAGLVPGRDIPIVFTGLWPGEKLTEDLLTGEEEESQSVRNGIRVARPPPPPRALERVEALADGNLERAMLLLRWLVPSYQPASRTPSRAGTGADLVGAGAWVMDEHLRVQGVRRPAPFRTRADVLRHGGFVHPSCLGQTRWFLLHPYDGAFVRAEDLELWARTADQSRFAFLDQPLLFYREPRRPSLAAFRASWRTERRVIRRYGPGALGGLEVAARAALTHVKALAYRLASPFPAAVAALLARRNTPVSDAERAAAEAALARAVAPPRRAAA